MKRLLPLAFLTWLLAACSAPPTLRVMTYNIHHGRGVDGVVDLERIAELVRAADVDLVALQEVDRGTRRTDGRDLASELAERCGMVAVFGPNLEFQGGEYGNAVLTRLPVRSHANHHYAMLRPGEQRGLLCVEVTWDGAPLELWNTHVDHRPDDAERVANLAEIHARLDRTDARPVLLCGDFNDTPGSRTHALALERFVDAWDAVGQGPGHTYPSPAPAKRIDYVFLRRGIPLEPRSAHIPPSEASDHLPLIVELVRTALPRE